MGNELLAYSFSPSPNSIEHKGLSLRGLIFNVRNGSRPNRAEEPVCQPAYCKADEVAQAADGEDADREGAAEPGRGCEAKADENAEQPGSNCHPIHPTSIIIQALAVSLDQSARVITPSFKHIDEKDG